MTEKAPSKMGASLLDAYSRRARLTPALLAILPLGIAIIAWFPADLKQWGLFSGVIVSAGGMILLAQAARVAGKSKEQHLFQLWGGKPTTRTLRYRATDNPVLLQRRHAQLQRLLPDLRLPSRDEEAADPEHADAVYETCVAYLLEKTRDRKRFALLFEDNCNYGFWRNIWGLRPIAIATSAVGLVCVLTRLYILRTSPDFVSVAAGVVEVGFLLGWLLWLTPSSVKLAADAYARTLLAACDELNP